MKTGADRRSVVFMPCTVWVGGCSPSGRPTPVISPRSGLSDDRASSSAQARPTGPTISGTLIFNEETPREGLYRGPSSVAPVPQVPPAVEAFRKKLKELGWVSDLLVAGSLATGDYVLGVSDLDLVAVVDGPVDASRMVTLAALHARLDEEGGAGLDLGCVYVNSGQLLVLQAEHPTWTHGTMVQRILSGVTRAELVRHRFVLFGRAPLDVFAPKGDAEVREAARAELLGYWTWAARRPWLWLWLNPEFADLGLTSMARGRHTLGTGELLTKTQAVEEAAVPAWLVDQLRARRRGEDVPSPRLRTAVLAWRDALRTVALAHVAGPRMQSQ